MSDKQEAGEAGPPLDASPETTARLLQDTIMVVDRGEEFEFRLPTTRDELRISSMLPRLRRIADPESEGEPLSNLDQGAYLHLRSIALFITCLKSTSAKWVADTLDRGGKPLIAWESWPPEVTGRVMDIALAFMAEVSRFHSQGPAA